MDIIFQLIVIAGVLKYSCKATFFNGYKGIILYTLLSGLIAFICYPVILKTNSDFFGKLVANKSIVSNIAVVITIEAISGMLISIGMLNQIFEPKKKRPSRILKLLPGLLIIGIIFYAELMLFRKMVGQPFPWIATTSVFLSMFVVFTLSLIIKKLLPDLSVRYELKFLINFALFILAIQFNAGLADYNTSNYNSTLNAVQILVFAVIVATGFLAGFFFYKQKHFFNRIFKKHRNGYNY